MASPGQLLFGKVPSFPSVWMFGLLGFIAFWWHATRGWTTVRRLFLVLWPPAALVSGAVYSLDGRGFAVTETLRGLLHRDPTVLQLVHWLPGNGVAATYAVIVGGAVSVLTTMALQLVGLVFGALLALGFDAD